MNKKLLFIVGPTATGKTLLSLRLAREFNGEIISADSRQVYKSMDIGTGKDIPKKFKLHNSKLKCKEKNLTYYGKRTRIWGYDLVNPNQEFSVAHFSKIAWLIIEDIWKRKKLPIIVGGTGFYIQALIKPFSSINIPPDNKLRVKLEKRNIENLQKQLKTLNPSRFNKLNQSDKNNPRRLIRAIEVALYKNHKNIFKAVSLKGINSTLWIGLKAPQKLLYKKIDQRIEQRTEKGAEKEVKALMKKGYNFSFPSMSALGYSQWKPYLDGKKTKQEIIERWKLDEHAYARRQMTWFKKNNNINWFDIVKPNWKNKVVDLVKQWYSKSKESI